MMHRPTVTVTVLVLAALMAAPVRAQDLALVNATLVDGTGQAPAPDTTVIVRSGRIAAIHDRRRPAGGRNGDRPGGAVPAAGAHRRARAPAVALRRAALRSRPG